MLDKKHSTPQRKDTIEIGEATPRSTLQGHPNSNQGDVTPRGALIIKSEKSVASAQGTVGNEDDFY